MPYQIRPSWRQTTVKLMLLSLLSSILTGVLPPSLVRSVLPRPAANLVEAALPAIPGAQAAGTISGTVFQDFNSNGVMNTSGATPNYAIDVGMAAITVSVYDSSGANVGTTTTRDGAGNPSAGAIGTYSLSVSGTGPYRIEFTNLPSGYYPTTHGSNSGSGTAHTGVNGGTTVQFVPDGTTANVNLGINRPVDYCQNNPLLCVNRLWFGNQITGTYSAESALLSFSYSNSGKTPTPTQAALASQIGTTWGIAWQRRTKTIYTAAFLKRHAGFGPNGPGAIYKVSAGPDGQIGTADDVVSLFLDMNTLGGVNAGANPHPPPNAGVNCFNGSTTGTVATGINDWCFDLNSYALIGKNSLGDIDLADDETTLYVMNLFDRRLYLISTATPTNFTSVTVPDPGVGATGCPLDPATPSGQLNLNVRPFALKYYNGKVYVGEVCTAQSTQNRNDLRAFVYEYNGSAFTQVLNFPLNFLRGTQSDGLDEQWHPWTDSQWPTPYYTEFYGGYVGYAQPWLTDIEFDRGNMVLGFRDRFGDQSGNIAGGNSLADPTAYLGVANGDLYRACWTGSAWNLESNGVCAGVTTAGANNGQGPGSGEYYYQDNASDNHLNLGSGGLAQVAGYADVVSTATDPTHPLPPGITDFNNLYRGGVTWNHYLTGARTRGYMVADDVVGYFGKANGIGDVEALCDAAPIELGNRVWSDADSDGLQDPNEAPISGVTVELYKNGVKVGQATTDATGEYYFTSGANSTDANTSDNIIHDGGIGIIPGTGTAGGNSLYEIRIPNISGGSKQPALGSNTLTSTNSGNNDSIDSDGTASGVNAVYTIPYADLASSGSNNHTYDFGFSTVGTLQIVKNTVGNDGAFTFTSTDTQLDAVSITTVSNTGNSGPAFSKSAGSYTISEDALLANWSLTSLSCSGDTDSGSVVTLASRQVAIDLDAGENIICTFTNTYTPSTVDLALVKTASVTSATPGMAFNYTLTVTNQSTTTTATNVTLTDPLPAGLAYNNATASGGTGGSCSYTSGTRTVTCTWATLPPGQQAVAVIQVTP